jgi:hypothetical protein
MGEATKVELDRLVLTRTGFRYEYHTGTYLNKEGKRYRLVYDYAWMDFSDQKVLVVRKRPFRRPEKRETHYICPSSTHN